MAVIEDLAQRLKKAGFKMTPARKAVIEVLENNHDHLCHNQILEEGQKIYPRLSRATVYRTMDILVELKLVRPLYLNGPTQRFVSALGGHHHLVCMHCGQTIEFNECVTGVLAQRLADQYNFQIHSHLLEFHGVCDSCYSHN